jgi:hypothetical protein
MKFEIHYLRRSGKLIWAEPAPFVAVLYIFQLCYYYYYYYYYYYTSKLAANTYYSENYELLH